MYACIHVCMYVYVMYTKPLLDSILFLKKTCIALCFSPAKVFVFLPSEGGVASQEVLSLYNPSKDQPVAYKVTYTTYRYNNPCSSFAMRQLVANSVRPLSIALYTNDARNRSNKEMFGMWADHITVVTKSIWKKNNLNSLFRLIVFECSLPTPGMYEKVPATVFAINAIRPYVFTRQVATCHCLFLCHVTAADDVAEWI